MKYKVIYMINFSGGGNPDGTAIATFYTYAQAQLSAQRWSFIVPGAYSAKLWNGNDWENYFVPA